MLCRFRSEWASFPDTVCWVRLRQGVLVQSAVQRIPVCLLADSVQQLAKKVRFFGPRKTRGQFSRAVVDSSCRFWFKYSQGSVSYLV